MAFDRIRKFISRKRNDLPPGLWTKCPNCQKMVYKKVLEERFYVCPECNFHMTLTPMERISMLVDHGGFQELWADMEPVDILKFKAIAGYKEKLQEAQNQTEQKDAIVIGLGRMNGRRVVLGVTDSRFLMGSMGSVVGEKVTRGFELATKENLPVVIVSGSGGGARMYEGTISLMQMAKTSNAIARFSDAGGLYISILTNPTMAGVMASFAGLGDILIAEPKALIGFTGPRVIKQTIKQKLPEGFQTSEFLLEHGFIDMIVERLILKETVLKVLGYLKS
jgi:acetyl-CoA carboxylase carboxyl transferase subunit beta